MAVSENKVYPQINGNGNWIMMIKQIDLALPYFQTNTIGVWHGPILRHTQVINPSE